MAKVAAELQYSDEHEWVAREDGNLVSIGISAVATDALGDIVYVDLPEVGSTVTAGETCGEVESTKSVSDLYSPVTGEVTSGQPSPSLGYPVALAYVDVAFTEPGTALDIDLRGKTEPFEVVALPFYKRQK